MAASQVDVQTQSLIDLRSALLTFRSSAGEQLHGIQQYLQRVWEVFEQAEQSAQAEVRRCEEAVGQLQAIAAAPGGAVVLPNLLEAAQQLRHAEAYLKKVRHHKREVEQAIQTYTRQAQRLHHHLANAIPRSAVVLNRKLEALHQYQSATSAAVTPSIAATQQQRPGSDEQGRLSERTTVHFLAKLIWLRRIDWGIVLEGVLLMMAALDWLAQQSPVHEPYSLETHPPAVSSAVQQLTDHNGIVQQQRKEANAVGRTDEPTTTAGLNPPEPWINRGIQPVPLADLPHPDGISGPDDFKKVTLAVMHAGIVRLQEMLPIIECGEGQNSDYWAQVDQQRGLPYEHGYQRVYEAFYGDSAIKLERIGNQYTIINGHHRLWLAKQMGIETLPAYVVESQGR